MEDIAAGPLESKDVEIWIHRQNSKGFQSTYIADELLKLWEQNRLAFSGKCNVSRYCLMNGFYPSMARILKNDLHAGQRLPWFAIWEVLARDIKSITKELRDALLTGATRDKGLAHLSAHALLSGDSDARWGRVLLHEHEEKQKELIAKKLKIRSEMDIFRNEGMAQEFRQGLETLQKLFPDDAEVQKLVSEMALADSDRNLEAIRNLHRRRAKRVSLKEAAAQWPELAPALERAKADLDADGAYQLSLGLHLMGLHDYALDVLRQTKSSWGTKEKLMEVEFTLARSAFAEALELTQTLLRDSYGQPEAVHAALYYSARAYHGLEDNDQAIGILRGLLQHCITYRDAALLLQEWEAEGQ